MAITAVVLTGNYCTSIGEFSVHEINIYCETLTTMDGKQCRIDTGDSLPKPEYADEFVIQKKKPAYSPLETIQLRRLEDWDFNHYAACGTDEYLSSVAEEVRSLRNANVLRNEPETVKEVTHSPPVQSACPEIVASPVPAPPMVAMAATGKGNRGTVPLEIQGEESEIGWADEPAGVYVHNDDGKVIEEAVYRGASRAMAHFQNPLNETAVEKWDRLSRENFNNAGWSEIAKMELQEQGIATIDQVAIRKTSENIRQRVGAYRRKPR